MPIVYAELHNLAEGQMRQQAADHTLHPSALVAEAFLKLIDQTDARWNDRREFYGFASKVMRSVLVDHARAKSARKRGGSWVRIGVSAAAKVESDPVLDMLALDEALEALAGVDAQLARIVELRFFGGLTTDMAAEVIGISKRSVERGYQQARLWLYERISSAQSG